VASLGLGARGTPVEMALSALVGPQAAGETIFETRKAVATLMKHLNSTRTSPSALLTVDTPTVIVPLRALVEVLSSGWSKYLVGPSTEASKTFAGLYKNNG
jgi:hypothetical protein